MPGSVMPSPDQVVGLGDGIGRRRAGVSEVVAAADEARAGGAVVLRGEVGVLVGGAFGGLRGEGVG
jgi:hypothetical protein